MALQLKDGFEISPETVWATQRVVRTSDGEVFATWTSNGMVNVLPRNGISGCACSNAELAHEYLLDCGSESPWVNVATDAELTAAAEGEGPETPRLVGIDHGQGDDNAVAFAYAIASKPPAPRLCAVDRLEAAGYELHVNDEFRRLHIMRPNSLTVFARNVLNTGRWEAWIDDGPKTASLYARSDESPGLNAALESLLSKPVGAVTVAQILGVA